MQPTEAFRPGPSQDRVLKGFASHGYDRHPRERAGLTRSQYAERGRRELIAAHRAVAFKQGKSENVVFGNPKTGMVGWINSANPERSTLFRPELGVDRYIAQRTRRLGDAGQKPRVLNLQKIRSAKPPVPPSARPPVSKSHGARAPIPKVAAPKPPASKPPAQPRPAMAKPAPPKPPAPRPLKPPAPRQPGPVRGPAGPRK